tara:strand:+ start:94 stop:2112 length:2019 start_codon:yes stop_codon:yes gene_type:complete
MSINKAITYVQNAMVGTNAVNKMMIGANQIWPRSKVVEFKTFQQGGELTFTVGSSTKYVAVTLDDKNVFIYSTSNGYKQYISAKDASTVVVAKYIMSDTFTNIPVNVPLYISKDITITGRGTSIARYGADNLRGVLDIAIQQDLNGTETFSVHVTGKSAITREIPPTARRSFSFTALPKGDKIVTVTNISTGDVYTRTAHINSSSSIIPAQSIIIGTQAADEVTTGSIEKSIKVYSLTESEAQANLQSTYGSDAIIGIDVRRMLNPHGYHYWATFFNIIHGGYDYPPNTRIGVMQYPGWTGHGYGKGAYSSSAWLRHCDLITNSDGVVVAIERQSDTDNWMSHSSTVESRLIAGNYGLHQLGASFRTVLIDYFADNTYGAIQRNNNENITSSGWRPSRGKYRLPQLAIPGSLYSSIKYWSNIIPHDFFYVAANSNVDIYNQRSGNGVSYGGYPEILHTAFIAAINEPLNSPGAKGLYTPGANNKHIDFIWTGEGESGQFAGGTWVSNLLIDNADADGHIESLELGDTSLTNIKVQNQSQFQILQSDNINSSGSNVQINTTPNFKSKHESGVTFEYKNGTWPVGFNPILYRQSYPNTIGTAYSWSDFEGLWYHYKTWGAAQGFTHSDDFLAQDYLDLHADLRAAFGSTGEPARTSAMLHWFSNGIAEGRQGRK